MGQSEEYAFLVIKDISGIERCESNMEGKADDISECHYDCSKKYERE